MTAPRRRRTTRHLRHLLGSVLAGAALLATTAGPASSDAAQAPRSAPDRPAAPLAPASPDLPGLASLAPELAGVPVDSAGFRAAEADYASAAAGLSSSQSARTALDRLSVENRGRQAALRSELVATRARLAGLTARLDVVEDAIADLSVSMYVSGLSAARMDAALTDEQPSINDDDRRSVLAESSLSVLLEERAAYRQRVDEAAAGVATATEQLDDVSQGLQTAAEARPTAVHDEVAAAAIVATERVEYEEARALATVEGVDFTLVALDAYRSAARVMERDDVACGVQWWAVAGISRVEGHHGTYGGSSVALGGDTTKRIIGIQLNGTNQTAVITDSDGGALDGDPAFDRAVGPMQFIPQTWARFAADGNGDGIASPFNLYDATLAAARYLCTASHGLAEDPGLRSAYFSYNHSEDYVNAVLGHARSYQRSVELNAPN